MIDHHPHGRVYSWTEGVELDGVTVQQAYATSRLQYIYHHVALMPDAHLGIGATVGSVIPTKGAIIPAAVGVDIGCGMLACPLENVEVKNMDRLELEVARDAIAAVVPVGAKGHAATPRQVSYEWDRLSNTNTYFDLIEPKLGAAKQSPTQQLGTMGGGNHFLEICLDENDNPWIMLHSGSRGIGNRIGRHFIEIAKRECETWGVSLPHKDLSYLPEGTDHYEDYVKVVAWAQDYAKINREMMLVQTVQALRKLEGPWTHANYGHGIVRCHHNYIAREHHFGNNVWVTRKGAIRAREDDLGIIPGSMGAESYIVKGKGNPMSFHSCSHGAGRKMSRRKAKEMFTVEDVIESQKGIVCRTDSGVIDEIKHAYKDIDAVMRAQEDLVEIVHTLRQVVNLKG